MEKLYAYLTPPEEVVPGKASWMAALCADCPARCGIHVKLREGRPIKIEGNPSCPVGAGATCARGQSTLQALYHPERIASPLLGRGKDKSPADPAEALSFLGPRLKGAREKKSLALVTPWVSGSSAHLYEEWARLLGADWFPFDPLAPLPLARAWRHLFGREGFPRPDLSRADYILGFGAEFVESWISPVELARQFAEIHSFQEGKDPAPFFWLAPRRDLSGAQADRWISIRPGTEGILALALAGRILELGGGTLQGEERETLRGWTKPYPLEETAGRAGCSPKTLDSLARGLAQAKAPVALPPGLNGAVRDATFQAAAVLALNHLLGATSRSFRPAGPDILPLPASHQALHSLLEKARAGEVEALVLVGRNPVYELPGNSVEESLHRVHTLVQVAEVPDETSPLADALLPAAHFLESWDDGRTREDWIGLSQPVYRPPGGARQAQDWLLALARAAGAPLLWQDFRHLLAERWREIQKALEPGKDPTLFFKEAQARGGVAWKGKGSPPPGPPSFAARNLPPAHPLPGPGKGPLLLPYPSGRLYDGRCADRPWIQELPDPLTQTLWDTPLEISPGLARKLGGPPPSAAVTWSGSKPGRENWKPPSESFLGCGTTWRPFPWGEGGRRAGSPGAWESASKTCSNPGSTRTRGPWPGSRGR